MADFFKSNFRPIFFKLIKKNDDSFGEGKFKALFESIEQEQIESGKHTAYSSTFWKL